MTRHHQTAVIDPAAELADDVEIGPYAIIGGDVRLREGVVVEAHSVIEGHTTIGAHSHLFPGAMVGLAPQHRGDSGETGRLEIGARCIIREHVTVNRGTDSGAGITVIGDDCFLMACSHVGHDCRVGNGVTLANGVLLGGHVEVGDKAFIGGLTAIHQNVSVGRLAMIGGVLGIRRNVPPFSLVRPSVAQGAILRGLNIVGLRRNGFDRSTLRMLEDAFQTLFGERETLSKAIKTLEGTQAMDPAVTELLEFLRSNVKRGILTGGDGAD